MTSDGGDETGVALQCGNDVDAQTGGPSRSCGLFPDARDGSAGGGPGVAEGGGHMAGTAPPRPGGRARPLAHAGAPPAGARGGPASAEPSRTPVTSRTAVALVNTAHRGAGAPARA